MKRREIRKLLIEIWNESAPLSEFKTHQSRLSKVRTMAMKALEMMKIDDVKEFVRDR